MNLQEWKKRADKGTSGDMVHDILRDWDEDMQLLRELFENNSIGMYPKFNENGADRYVCPCCGIAKRIDGYALGMESINFTEHRPECKLVQLYRLVQASPGV